MNCPQELPQAPAGKHYHLCADGCQFAEIKSELAEARLIAVKASSYSAAVELCKRWGMEMPKDE